MIRPPAIAVLALVIAACKQPAVPRAKITEFKVTPSFIPTGITGKLCYGVENAVKLDLNPPVEELLPATERCIDIAPKQTTTYTLTAFGKDAKDKDGKDNEDTKSLEVRVGAPPPRLSNISATPTGIKRGAAVKVCFKVENAKSVKVSPGKLDRRTNCLVDRPKKTTTYRITALGQDREEDSGTVTVQVAR
jgi:hypothetical protein